MKLVFFFLWVTTPSIWAKSIVLVSYFDSFGDAPFNNSERVALELGQRFNSSADFELKTCRLQTVFDKSFFQFEECLRALPQEPALVIGLGESNCSLKVELMGRNLDKTKGADNDGNERINTPIIPEGPREVGFTYPLDKMYCALAAYDRGKLEVSNNAGSFVCNNFAYQVIHNYAERLKFGFIHVPANNCRNLEARTEQALLALEAMIPVGVKNSARALPTKKRELELIRTEMKDNSCLSEFYRRAKGADERGPWPF